MKQEFNLSRQIQENLNQPENMEQLFRTHKKIFADSFQEATKGIDSELVRFWRIRLTSETKTLSNPFALRDVLSLVLITIVFGLMIRIPGWFSLLNQDLYYTRNLAWILFSGWILFFHLQSRNKSAKPMWLYWAGTGALALYTNLLPQSNSDSIVLALVHIPLTLWCVLGLVYISYDFRNIDKRIDYIRFNGEWIILTGLIALAGMLMAALTMGLFSAIEINIEEIYLENVIAFGGVAAPMVAYYLIQHYPSLTKNIAPVIARIFTPLILITLAIYLSILIFSRDQILNDRDLLILFNGMLVAVMALIVFSVSGIDHHQPQNFQIIILILLAILALIVNGIALTAIISRVMEGLTPNRTVVLCSNILICTNLILVLRTLIGCYFKGWALQNVEQTIARYLSIYAMWAVVVVFLWPLLFGFR